jgi:hypothetical protein
LLTFDRHQIHLIMSQCKEEEVQKQAELHSFTSRAHWSVLYCQICRPSKLPSITNVMQHFQYSWAVMVSCDSCHEQWNICNICDSVRKPFLDKQSLYNHYYKYHNNNKAKIAPKKAATELMGIQTADQGTG